VEIGRLRAELGTLAEVSATDQAQSEFMLSRQQRRGLSDT
jgi:hypothetical protein